MNALPMLILAALIFIIVSFGVGFILNMLTKFWLTSVIVFLVVLAVILFRSGFVMGGFNWFLVAVSAFGAFASAYAIKILRDRGFRMFQ